MTAPLPYSYDDDETSVSAAPVLAGDFSHDGLAEGASLLSASDPTASPAGASGLDADGGDVAGSDGIEVRAPDSIGLLTSIGSGYFSGSGTIADGPGESGVARANSDFLNGGPDHDRLVGDAEHRSVAGDTTLGVAAGTGADHGGGSGGSDTTVHAMGDVMSAYGGDDLLFGDVLLVSDTGRATLIVAAGVGGPGGDQPGGAGGNDNNVFGFDDRLAGGTGDDTLIGDLASDQTTGSIDLSALAGQGGGDGEGGDANGGRGGDHNWVGAFNDRLDAGDGQDLLVGDLSVANFKAVAPQDEIRLTIASGSAGSYTSENGGSGNVVRAFDDTMDGGDGDDLLIGDIRYLFATPHDGDLLVLDVQGASDNRVNAFCDSLSGGAGDDTIFGDCFDGKLSFSPQVWSQPESGRLFADTLDGGDGNDVLVGGMGADVMTGGEGDDVFRWDVDDLWETPVKGVDRITDFSAGDTLDLRHFFKAFAFDAGHEPDASFLRLTQDGNDTLVAYSLTGGPLYETFARLENFTTDESVQDLIDHGTILIA